MLLDQLLRGVALPMLAATAVFALAWGLARYTAFSRAGLAGAVALPAGYTAGHVGLIGWPAWPPIDATSHWPVYLALAGAGVALVAVSVPAPAWVRALLRVLLASAVPALLLRPRLQHSWSRSEGALWLIALAVLIGLVWTVLERAALEPASGGSGGVLTALVLTLTAALGSAAVLISGSALLAQLAGALAAALGVAVVAACLLERSFIGAVPVAVLLIAAFWINGYFYVAMPAASVLLLAVAPLAAGLPRLPLLRRYSSYQSAAIALLVTLVLAAAAVALAYRSAPEPYYPG